MNDMTDPRSEGLEWIRASQDAREARLSRERMKRRSKLKHHRETARRAQLRREWRLNPAQVGGMHEGTGLWLTRVQSRDHLTVRAYGVASQAGVFAAVALDRDAVVRLHTRLGNVLAQWKP